MITIERRAMTSNEQSTVEALSKAGPSGFSGWVDRFMQYFMVLVGMPVIGMLVGGLLGFILEVMFEAQVRDPSIMLGVFLSFVIGCWRFWKERQVAGASRQKYQDDLTAGAVEVLRCTATDATEVGGSAGEAGYFLDVGDSKILFLQGQFLYDLDDVFPNHTFDVIRTPHSQTVLQVICSGTAFRSSRKRKPLSNHAYKSLHDKQLVVFEGSLKSLEEDLDRIPTTR